MKILINFLLICSFCSCLEDTQTHSSEMGVITETYRSTNESYRKDFYLSITGNEAIIYCWDVNPKGDTVYYWSKGNLEKGNHNELSFDLTKHVFSKTKISEKNLGNLIEDKDENFVTTFLYSSFVGGQIAEGSIRLQGVKHIYDSRADVFLFERIK